MSILLLGFPGVDISVDLSSSERSWQKAEVDDVLCDYYYLPLVVDF